MKRLLLSPPSLLLALVVSAAPVHGIWRDFDDAEAILGNQALPSPTRLFSSMNVTCDTGSGKVFICDSGNNRVLRFSSAAALGSGQAAEAAFGQPDLYSGTAGTSQSKLTYPIGAAVDGAGRLWVADTENSRIMRWDNALTAPSGALASQVLGAPDFNTRGGGTTQNRLSRPNSVDIDSQGRLWVADYNNSRVLRFDNAAAKGINANADGVIGQLGFTTAVYGCTASNFKQPYDLDIDAQDRLWVADIFNSRVLRFDNPSADGTANGVLCQTDFESSGGGSGPGNANYIPSLDVSPTGTLYALDTQNARVLRWDNAAAKANGANADGVLGRMSLASNATYSDTPGYVGSQAGGLATDAAGHLWLTDRYLERTICWANAATKPNGANAETVIGHNDPNITPTHYFDPTRMPRVVRGGVEDPVSGKFFMGDDGRVLRYTSRASAESGNPAEAVFGKSSAWGYGFGDPSQTELSSTWGVALDATGKLWVSDTEANRVLGFANALTSPSGSPAAVVLGQSGFDDSSSALAQNRMHHPRGLTLDAAGNLYVADCGNHRVLRFNNVAAKTSGANADAVLGQQNFIASSQADEVYLLENPSGVSIDADGRLWVADTANHRVARYDTPLSAIPLAVPSGTLGIHAGATASAMQEPVAAVVDGAGRLFVLDTAFNRILRFDNAKTKPNGADADGLLGAMSFTHSLSSHRTRNAWWRPYGLFMDAAKNLWVGDESNERVLRYSAEATAYITQSGPVGGNFQLTFHGEAGITYTVKSSTDLKTWQPEATYPFASSGTQIFSKAKAGTKRFYCVEEP
ncbi:NHL repeat-containing protein [Luteolibacter sp. Populi]|uniref:NHL repeat-containing protein n=1 Tax=Luteolibacter sp. Populi TaxID=3230487 RepID=UPI003467DBAC